MLLTFLESYKQNLFLLTDFKSNKIRQSHIIWLTLVKQSRNSLDNLDFRDNYLNVKLVLILQRKY